MSDTLDSQSKSHVHLQQLKLDYQEKIEKL